MVAWPMQQTKTFDSFFTRHRTRRSKPRGRRPCQTEQHLRRYLEVFDTASDDERTESARKAWMPPREIIEALLDGTLLQRDRVELVIATYGVLHPGHSPSWEEIGRILGIVGKVAAEYGRQLIKAERAEMRDGKFCLRPAGYSHPIIRARYPALYRILQPSPAGGLFDLPSQTKR